MFNEFLIKKSSFIMCHVLILCGFYYLFAENSLPENSSLGNASPEDSSLEKKFPGGGRFFTE
jgi:hypothetical protein